MTAPPPSPTRRNFEALARARDWPNAGIVYNGLAMFEMLPAYAALDPSARVNFKRAVLALAAKVNQPSMRYAFSVVDDMQMPLADPPDDLHATGQEEDAREFLAPAPDGLRRFFFDNLLALYPQGTPSGAKRIIGGHVDADWITNTCAVRISRVLDYSGLAIPNGDSTLAVVSGGDKLWYSYRQKELQAWFTRRVGAPSLTLGASPDKRKLWNLKGFIGFDIHFSDATGHFDLWDGKQFQLQAQATHDYFAVARGIVFWRVPS
jgi:hypothetical protein